ncbi:MAG: type I-E CRISPR-associated endoribonuclease Cas2e [Oscillospiraceae bacterium]|nr:type I-E CRISPR-associated endoribonuclease Cas2e [Oscillospiraceae bacterium]
MPEDEEWVVVTLTNCPHALRGDLSKWLQEINTGVYAGKVSARVRDQLCRRTADRNKWRHAGFSVVLNRLNSRGNPGLYAIHRRAM